MACETSGQPQIFNKNKLDIENVDVNITITDAVAVNTGQAYTSFMRDRRNWTAWMTTESTDAANTEILLEYGDFRDIDSILLVGHNLKNYEIEYWTGLVWANVTKASDNTAVAPTDDDQDTTFYLINKVNTDKMRIIIYGTQVADSDKRIQQLITTTRIGKFEGWPVIRRPQVSTNKRNTKMLSGRNRIVESLEAFSCTFDVKNWKIQNDIDIIETMYFIRQGVLVWINSDKPTQFALDLKGYRREDIFLMRPQDSWRPELSQGLYKTGIKQSIKLVEVIT